MNGGAIPISDSLLDALIKARECYGIVLVFDEVITINRAGLGGMQQKLGVSPDLTLVGKTLAGGALPVSAIGGSGEIMRLIREQKVVQAGTFNGYHAGMAAVLATYAQLEEPGRLEGMFQRGISIRSELERIGHKMGFPIVTQGIGGCFCVHPGEKVLYSPAQWTAQMCRLEGEIQKKFFERRVCIAPKLRFYLNIDIEDGEIEELLQISEEVFREMGQEYPL